MRKLAKVCLIDDDQIYLFAMRRIIQHLELCDTVEDFSNPETALAAFRNWPDGMPDLIMVDINMPVMDGWQFLSMYQTIVSKLSTKPALYMVSSSIDEADVERANLHPLLDGYLVKPITAEKLLAIFGQD